MRVEDREPGDEAVLALPGQARFRLAMRSPVPVDHLELVQDGKVVRTFPLTGDRRSFDAAGTLPVAHGGWLLLRAWNDGDDPLVFDRYPYATTTPVWLAVAGAPRPRDPADAEFFLAWIDRLIANAGARDDWNNGREKSDTLAYLAAAKAIYAGKAGMPR